LAPKFDSTNSCEIWIEIQISLQFCVTLWSFLKLWSFENYTSKFRPHLKHKISCSFSPSPSTHLLLCLSFYPWLPKVVNLFLTHLLLEVASPIIFLHSPFRCHSSSRSKWLHWWRKFKAYKLHMELHHPPLQYIWNMPHPNKCVYIIHRLRHNLPI